MGGVGQSQTPQRHPSLIAEGTRYKEKTETALSVCFTFVITKHYIDFLLKVWRKEVSFYWVRKVTSKLRSIIPTVA